MAETLDAAVERYHLAARAFARGNAEPVKALLSDGDDVGLANPFGPAVHGRKQVCEALDYAASRFADGDVTGFEGGIRHEAADLASIFEIERWEARVSGREDLAPFELRVTTVFRREDGAWRLVHRHADPISTPHPDGPLRSG